MKASSLPLGAYACGKAMLESDIDLVATGGEQFLPKNIFALGEELRELTGCDADIFEFRKVNKNTRLFDVFMKKHMDF